jgi:hypothetical protein
MRLPARTDGKPLAFAGLWESYRWPDETVLRSLTIMTTTPNAEMDELHDRMPVILDEADWLVWLDEAEGDHDRPEFAAGWATGHGDVPLIHLPLRCGCGSGEFGIIVGAVSTGKWRRLTEGAA